MNTEIELKLLKEIEELKRKIRLLEPTFRSCKIEKKLN